MAVLTPGSMKNKISFYRESMTVNNSGEKVKTVSIIKRDVGAEFKYIGTPSAGASEERIQEQRTGKIKAEIRCRYFKGVKFEDVIYFEGGKFRIYSIQYEGRHEVLKIRAELRDDDTFLGLPDQDYPFISHPTTHYRNPTVDYVVVNNSPFPKRDSLLIRTTGNGSYEIITGDNSSSSFQLGNIREYNSALEIVEDIDGTEVSDIYIMNEDKFIYKTALSPAAGVPTDGYIRSYTSRWYDLFPNNSTPDAKIVLDSGELVVESSPNTFVLIPADETEPTYLNSDGFKTYKLDTTTWPYNELGYYHLPHGPQMGKLYYSLTPITGVSEYIDGLNSRDAENSVTKTDGGVVKYEYSQPISFYNHSINYPSDVTSHCFRQEGERLGVFRMSNMNYLLAGGNAKQPETGNIRFKNSGGNTSEEHGLFVSSITSVSVILPNGEELTVDSNGDDISSKFVENVPSTGRPGIQYTKSEDPETGEFTLPGLNEPSWVGATLKILANLGPTTNYNRINFINRVDVPLLYKIAK
jgi:hypothetical protein